MTVAKLQTDIAIIDGGIAGSWLLNQLRNARYSAVLFECEALGMARQKGYLPSPETQDTPYD